MEVTGVEKANKTVPVIIKSLEVLKGYADFEEELVPNDVLHNTADDALRVKSETISTGNAEQISLGLAYTINLVLPKTDDVAVYNAIFKSLRENLLRK